MKIDLHIHTKYSYDAFITPEDLVFYAKRRNLDGVAITDHNTVNGLREFSKIQDPLVIQGIEIATKQGHVLAINVDTVVTPGLSFAETVDQIHEAGGLAIVAHPTAFFKGISEEELDQNFDAMEVINSSAVPFSFSVRKNHKIATKLCLSKTGGSDAHSGAEIGMAYTLIESEADVEEIVKAIKNGNVTPFGKAIPWSMRLKREIQIYKRRFSWDFLRSLYSLLP